MSNSNTAPAFSSDPAFDASTLDYIASVLPGMREHLAYLDSLETHDLDSALSITKQIARVRQEIAGGEAILARYGR